MSQPGKIALAVLLLAVAVGAIYLRGLHRRVLELARGGMSAQQARREMTVPPVTATTAAKAKARLFWLSTENPGAVEPVETELALSAEPAERARQLLHALIASPPSAAQRSLPAEAEVLAFYILPDGTAIADFSSGLSSAMPSGIASERLAIESVVRTLEANVPEIQRLKIVIQGQEAESLAGHLDLSEPFEMERPATQAPGKPVEKPAGR